MSDASTSTGEPDSNESAVVAHVPVARADAVTQGEVGPLEWWSPGAWLAALSIAAVLASVWQIGLGRTDRGFFVLALTSLVLTAAALVDAGCRRIPNRLTYPAILLGFTVNLIVPALLTASGAMVPLLWLGATTPTDALLGFALCAVVGIGSFAAGGLGGGDAKVLGMLGAFMGLAAVVPVLFNAILIAALVGLVNLLSRGRLVLAMQRGALAALRVVWPSLTTSPPAQFRRSEAPFAVSLLLGFALAQAYSPLDDFVHLVRSYS